MIRESKPTLQPNKVLSPVENDTFSRFLSVTEKDPIFALSCIRNFLTNSEVAQEARRFSEEEPSPEGQVLQAIADLVDSEVVFVLEPDKQTKAAEAKHTLGREVASMAKIKGYLGELSAHHFHDEAQELRDVALKTIQQDYAEFSTDSDLQVTVFDSRPNLDAA
jgi:hypothetical protein